MFLLLFLFIFLSSYQAQAEVYQWDESYFSDQPKVGAKKLKIHSDYAYYSVKRVFDGDTILLENGTRVRFLSINTPEVARRNKMGQPGGEKAKNWLIKKLKNQKVRLEKDVERHDKYSRVLAHLFTSKNEHINLELVQQGLASVNIFPPNLKYVDQLVQAENLAEKLKIGIWKIPHYKPKLYTEVNRSNSKGWQRIQGVVSSIKETRSYVTLVLSDTFLLKIKKKSMGVFPDIQTYLDKKIEIRGWINKQKKRYIMYIRHPSQIKIISSIPD